MTKSDTIGFVLGKLVDLYDIDTSVLWPDDPLSSVGISEDMAKEVVLACLKEIGCLEISDFNKTVMESKVPSTAREMVELVYCEFTKSSDYEKRLAA